MRTIETLNIHNQANYKNKKNIGCNVCLHSIYVIYYIDKKICPCLVKDNQIQEYEEIFKSTFFKTSTKHFFAKITDIERVQVGLLIV